MWCFLNCQFPARGKGLRRSAGKWRCGMEPNLFPMLLLSVTRGQKGFVPAVERDVELV